jgi:hypothetical protein
MTTNKIANIWDAIGCLADTMGELKMLYAAAYVAFVGNMVLVGGHNLLEASAIGTLMLFGSTWLILKKFLLRYWRTMRRYNAKIKQLLLMQSSLYIQIPIIETC